MSLTECDVSANDLGELPPTIGLLRHLRTLIADENFLSDIPCELGSCSGLTVLSGRLTMPMIYFLLSECAKVLIRYSSFALFGNKACIPGLLLIYH